METILARQETHDWIADALSKEKRGSVLDVPAGSGAFGLRLKKMGSPSLAVTSTLRAFLPKGLRSRKAT